VWKRRWGRETVLKSERRLGDQDFDTDQKKLWLRGKTFPYAWHGLGKRDDDGGGTGETYSIIDMKDEGYLKTSGGGNCSLFSDNRKRSREGKERKGIGSRGEEKKKTEFGGRIQSVIGGAAVLEYFLPKNGRRMGRDNSGREKGKEIAKKLKEKHPLKLSCSRLASNQITKCFLWGEWKMGEASKRPRKSLLSKSKKQKKKRLFVLRCNPLQKKLRRGSEGWNEEKLLKCTPDDLKERIPRKGLVKPLGEYGLLRLQETGRIQRTRRGGKKRDQKFAREGRRLGVF